MQGALLNGRYELHEPLGTGGMATVWRGVDRVLERPVAVKVLSEGLAEDSRFAERFAREARHAASLAHPAIVTVFDTGEDESGTPYLVMELVDGRTLAELLERTPRLPVERAVAIASAVCEALQIAHAAGLVHRDIKPGNIMVADGGQVKVVDFGIAKAGNDAAQLTGTGSVLGTAAYLAPEQATASGVDGRADLYALGCVLVEMLTGRPPFVGATPVEVAWMHVSERPAPPSSLRPDIPAALDAAVLALLEKEPGRRPADAASARTELQAAVTGHGAATAWMPPVPGPAPLNRTMAMPPLDPSSGPVPAVEPAYRSRPRRRRTGLIAAAVVAVLACVGAAVASQSSGSGTPTAGAASGAPVSAPPSAAPTSAAPAAAAPSPRPTGAAGMIASLRDAVAAANLTEAQQHPLLGALDKASQDLTALRPGDAAQAIHDAQRDLRKLSREHAVDRSTNHTWSVKLASISTALRKLASADGQDGGGAGAGTGPG
ncbi:protein kinase domain-containing protein [Streptacidiphilus melanogenes]|uniref:protein kinase domain-containing protein n=1 Tax=Streptacidiphilus melanogenes TaxID=411235 RepID=UPI00069331A9|nr:protein kinase [Streptacidiphilus melanogenes]